MTADTQQPKKTNWLSIGLWTAQILLGVGYAMFGALKLFTPIADLSQMMLFVANSPEWLPRFIGLVEIAGALGMILPAALKILPWLTPLAAAGFSAIQIIAIVVHANLGETASTLPINLVLLTLSLFVLWGRWKKLPIQAGNPASANG